MQEQNPEKMIDKTKNKERLVLLSLVILMVAYWVIQTTWKHSPQSVSPSSSVPQQSQGQSQQYEVMLVIDSGTERKEYEIKIASGSTVLDLLSKAKSEQGLSFSYSESDLGAFIEEINGVKNDPKVKKFWTYKINGKAAELGASNYTLNNADVIEWDYTEF